MALAALGIGGLSYLYYQTSDLDRGGTTEAERTDAQAETRDKGILLGANKFQQNAVDDLYTPQVLPRGSSLTEVQDVMADDQTAFAVSQARYAFRARKSMFNTTTDNRLPLPALANPYSKLYGKETPLNQNPFMTYENGDVQAANWVRYDSDATGAPHRNNMPYWQGPGHNPDGSLPSSMADRNAWSIVGTPFTLSKQSVQNSLNPPASVAARNMLLSGRTPF